MEPEVRVVQAQSITKDKPMNQIARMRVPKFPFSSVAGWDRAFSARFLNQVPTGFSSFPLIS
jgi:hypothetical protein